MKTTRRNFLKLLTAAPLAVALNKVNAVSEADKLNNQPVKMYVDKTSKQCEASAWVNFDGSKNPPEILGSYNVSKVSKGAPGSPINCRCVAIPVMGRPISS